LDLQARDVSWYHDLCREKVELQGRKCKWEKYKGTRYSDGDSTLVVELWLHRVTDDLSGLTFQEWDPSAGTDDTSAVVTMFVNAHGAAKIWTLWV
jgi:hypothetical protein